MVLTRNQKKNQNISNNNNNENNTNENNINENNSHNYSTRSKSKSKESLNKTDDKNINNKNDIKDIKNNDKKEIEKQQKNTKLKPKQFSNTSSMMQMAMPFSMMFFNIAKKPLKKNISDDEKCNSDCNGCENCFEDTNDEHDIDCECEECEEEDDEEEYFDYMNKIKLLKEKIPNMKINDDLKNKFMEMLKSSNLDDKRLEWFDTLTKIPFGEYSKYEVDINDNQCAKEYIKNVYKNLENSVWGMYDVKEEILNYVAQCITQPESKPRVLALCGQPGIGKTKIVRDGISKSLQREMKCFSMGGIKDSSTFFGFDYTYVGSKYGAIVQALIDCKTMNPILFFDELDKISDTKDGQDIENFLIHLTDPVQNYDFNDKYFNGIPIDISKSLLIFSFNNIENISPILKDRLHIINIPSPSIKDKVNIAGKFFVKEFLNNFKLNENEVIFDNDIIKYVIERYTDDENGVRKLRRCIETICMKINTNKLLGECVKELNLSTSKIKIELPIKLTREHINVLLYKEPKNEKIPFMYT